VKEVEAVGMEVAVAEKEVEVVGMEKEVEAVVVVAVAVAMKKEVGMVVVVEVVVEGGRARNHLYNFHNNIVKEIMDIHGHKTHNYVDQTKNQVSNNKCHHKK
jgi:hypothetical protein